MYRKMIRLFCLALALLLAAGTVPARADGYEWTCPSCGQKGNTGNFCSNCGAGAPAAEWTCASCGHTGNTGNFCSNCGAQKGSQAASETAVDYDLEQIPGQKNHVKVVASEVYASSYIVNVKEPDKWLPEYAADGNETTCWQFSTKKDPLGKANLIMYYDNPQTADAVWFKPGFWAVNTDGESEYPMNARPKQVRLELQYSGSNTFQDPQIITLQDDKKLKGWQKHSLGHRENITAVRLTILSAYKGNRYPNDVCLSEVMLVKDAPASTAREAGTVVPRIYDSTVGPREATLISALATRSGPATEYESCGSFFRQGWENATVTVKGKSHDGNIWWVLVEFSSGSYKYRVWTGLKRVNVNIDKIPEIVKKGEGTLYPTSETRRGPGKKYAKAKVNVTSSRSVIAFGRENGYVEVEYKIGKSKYRFWVPQDDVSITWK